MVLATTTARWVGISTPCGTRTTRPRSSGPSTRTCSRWVRLLRARRPVSSGAGARESSVAAVTLVTAATITTRTRGLPAARIPPPRWGCSGRWAQADRWLRQRRGPWAWGLFPGWRLTITNKTQPPAQPPRPPPPPPKQLRHSRAPPRPPTTRARTLVPVRPTSRRRTDLPPTPPPRPTRAGTGPDTALQQRRRPPRPRPSLPRRRRPT
mmetsp:Transcript_13763/g.33889  ORF Transcript_13763/g.33889 Transcript_13763/m.33889 type:complete len:209 (-) Transcript_13763:300-926(-)